MTIEEVKAEILKIQTKIGELEYWLNKHSDHPDRMKVIGDLNHFRVKLKTKELNLYNLRHNLPTHGLELPPESPDHLDKPKTTRI